MTAFGPGALDMPRTAASRVAWAAVLAYLLFVAFQLYAPLAEVGDIGRFLRAPAPAVRDALENLLLTVPLGALVAVARWAGGRALGPTGLIVAMAVAALVAVPMELAQSYMPLRSPSWWDAAMMLLGGGAGYVAATPILAILGRRFGASGVTAGALVPLAVAVLWPLWFWIPRLLELSPAILRAGWAPLTGGVALDPLAILAQGAGWLAVAALLRQAMSRRQAGIGLSGLLLAAWGGLLLSPGRQLTWDALIAGTACIGIAVALPRSTWLRLAFAVLLALVTIGTAVSLAGGSVPDGGLPVVSLPFAELRGMGRLDAAIQLGAHYALVAAPLVLAPLAETRCGGWIVVVAAALAVIAAQFVTGWLGGAVATTPIAVYGLGAALLALASDGAGRGAQRQEPPGSETLTQAWERQRAAGTIAIDPHAVAPSRRRISTFGQRLTASALRAAAMLVILAVGIWGVIQLPFVPYNVRELFDGRVLLASLPLLALFLIAGSAAPPVLAGALLRWPALHILQPLLYPLMASPVWLLLRYAVSAESLHDILGAPVLGWPGDWELFLRFLALAAVPMLSLTVAMLLLDGGRRLGWARGIGHAMLATMMAVPWAIVAKLVVVDLASTDNLIELVAWQHGWIALAAIGLAVGVVSLNGALVGVSLDSEGLSAWMSLLIVTAVLAVASWGLVTFSLAPGALDFLLGPRRGIAFGPLTLLLLWSILHVGVALMTGIGRWIAGPLIGGQHARGGIGLRSSPA